MPDPRSVPALGFSVSELVRQDFERIADGNCSAWPFIRITQWCLQFEAPFVLANPWSSRLFRLPEVEAIK
eukprot:6767079-Lingulodinium_polyedra.AAC.1